MGLVENMDMVFKNSTANNLEGSVYIESLPVCGIIYHMILSGSKCFIKHSHTPK